MNSRTRALMVVMGLLGALTNPTAKADDSDNLSKTVALQQAQIQQLQKQLEKMQLSISLIEENNKLLVEKKELPNLATKNDLQSFALKSDLTNFLPCGRQVRIATSSGQWYLTSSPDDIVRATRIESPSDRQKMFVICP